MEGVDDSLVSDTESSTAPSPVAAVAEDVAPAFLFARAFFAFLLPADPIRDGSALGDDAAASVEDAEDEEPREEPRVLFALFFFLGTAGGAVVEACCSCCCSLAERLTVVVDPPCTGGGGNAGVSERLAISSAIVSAVAVGGAAAAVAAVARGTSTKSAVSDRGDWRGGDVERRAEEERDQTISSSSEERESLAHRELEVNERTSSEDESEVDICWVVERSSAGGGVTME